MGFEYDRIFMLQRVEGDKSMHVPHFPSMCLFTTEISPTENPEKILVRFGLNHTFDKPDQKLPDEGKVLEVPLRPDVKTLKQTSVLMHSAPTNAFVMPEETCKWFSDRFGFEVRLLYIGLNKRHVLGQLNPNAPRAYVGDGDPRDTAMSPSGGWLDGLKTGLGNVVSTVASYTGVDAFKGVEDGLTFADVAAFLVVNYKSHVDAQERVETEIEVEKFRPNIVVDGAEAPWEEDYWGEIGIGDEETGTRIAFTANCPRCASINVDYDTGRMAEGGKGKLLKSLQSDRRVDPGNKYSPIMGRYGFLSSKNGVRPDKPVTISVGDEVQVTKLNERRTHFCKLISIPVTTP